MNIQELCKKLKELNISDNLYYIHGLCGSPNDDEKLSMIIKKDMEGMRYEIYFKERGVKSIIRVFNSEEEACYFFLREVLKEIL